MGGDHGPRITVPAAIGILNTFEDLSLQLIGSETELQQHLDKAGPYPAERLQIHHASDNVAMDESPTSALRKRIDSSMRLAINAVANGSADACVSAGNTGALMAMGHHVLKTLEGIERAAICTSIPTLGSHSLLLDMGANVDCSARQLHQFAMMASVLASVINHVSSPRVALLNIGTEANKGNALVRETAVLLEADTDLNYVGFVEGDELFYGKADVIVCDGFAGNVALKVSEGTARFIKDRLKKEMASGLFNRMILSLAHASLAKLKKQLDPDEHNGASLLGLNGLVVKSHGSADQRAYGQAIVTAYQLAKADVAGQLADRVASAN
jgi:glycerol-3-phosphate acyltransferase PlsX